MAADYERAVAEHVIELLEEDGAVIALIELVPAEDHWLIENLAVDPEHQGEGLGDRMLRHAEALARAEGVDELRLYTNAVFASNLTFYARRGFEEWRRGEMVPGSVTVFMRKSVGAA